jgi:HD superfamily phosphodiesterase
MIERQALIDDILKEHRSDLNVDYDKYRHHVYRVYNFALLLHEEDEKADTDTLAIAAAFHDIGIWTDGTFDYLSPSIGRAKEYIRTKKLKVSGDEVEEIISNHHKLTRYSDNKLAESFRKADLIDLTLGIISHGVSHRDILELYQTFPESNFHIFILKEAAIHTFKNPLSPLPFFKW